VTSRPAGPLPNRVTPLGVLVAEPARGLLMGNRGRLHDDARRLTGRGWTTRASGRTHEVSPLNPGVLTG
jgi:hypothetical protein